MGNLFENLSLKINSNSSSTINVEKTREANIMKVKKFAR